MIGTGFDRNYEGLTGDIAYNPQLQRAACVDIRYKFLMTYADGSIQYWGTKNTTDSNPGAATPEDPYFYIMETPDNQWDQKWKLNDEFDGAADGHNPGAITKISVIFNVENYTHKVELAN